MLFEEMKRTSYFPFSRRNSDDPNHPLNNNKEHESAEMGMNLNGSDSMHSDLFADHSKSKSYKHLVTGRQTSRLRIILFILGFTAIFYYLAGGNSQPPIPESQLLDEPYWDPQTPKGGFWSFGKGGETAYSQKKHIPNIAHFVRQINRDENYTPKAPFRVEFRHLLSYYSCHHYLKPEKIYFWTDTPREMLEDARLNGDLYTRALFRIPNLEFRSAIFPNRTSKGIEISQYAHRSDFVRTRVMAKMGGQYFDDDAWVLRDLKPLREAGFDNVFSLDEGARIAQAAWLSKPRNPLMIAFAKLQDIVFNGDWLRASNDLVTSLMVHFSRLPGGHSSMVLEKDAFFPGYWIGDALNMYYEVHDFDPNFIEPINVLPEHDPLETFQYDFDWGWRRDWRRTWIIHGFSNELRARKGDWMFKEFKGFTPAYILSKRSNIARALYPVLRHMLDIGFLDLEPRDLVAPL